MENVFEGILQLNNTHGRSQCPFQDKALMEDPIYGEFWQRDVEESNRQRNVKPFMEEAALQVANWGFSLSDLKLQKRKRSSNLLSWLKSMFTETEEYMGFLGPIHIWQVSTSMFKFLDSPLTCVHSHKSSVILS